MTSTITAIRGKIETLLAERERVEGEIKQHSKRLEAAKASLRVVEGKLAVLKELSDELGESPPRMELTEDATQVTIAPTADTTEKLRPADAVRDLLRQCPDGLTQHAVVSELHDKIESDSTDKKRLLYNTIFNLKKRGMVREVEINGRPRLFLNEVRPGEHENDPVRGRYEAAAAASQNHI